MELVADLLAKDCTKFDHALEAPPWATLTSHCAVWQTASCLQSAAASMHRINEGSIVRLCARWTCIANIACSKMGTRQA